jgi:hypothetical protein
VTVIEIRPLPNGWQVYECAGVQPFFLTKEQAIDYAKCRACFRSGEIRVVDSNGATQSFSPVRAFQRMQGTRARTTEQRREGEIMFVRIHFPTVIDGLGKVAAGQIVALKGSEAIRLIKSGTATPDPELDR